MESKGNLKKRLKLEGRWYEFVDCRENLKNQGIEPEEAYLQAAAKFPPLSDTDKPDDRGDTVDDPGNADESGVRLSDFADRPPVSARKVVQWVFDNIDVSDVTAKDAPSGGAWSLLERVRKYPDLLKEFYRTIWAKMLPTRSEIEATEKFEDDGRQQLDIIDKLQRAARQEDER